MEQGPFRFEREMMGPAESWLASLGLSTKREYSTPWGKCDLVGLSFNSRQVRKRQRLGQVYAVGSALRVRILQDIPDASSGESVDYETLRNRFDDAIGCVSIQRELTFLLSRKFIQEVCANRFQRVNGWEPLHKRIVAVELKISRIKEAVGQASAHSSFADESYVGLPWPLAERTLAGKRIEAFKESGTGLVAIGRNKCKILLRSSLPHVQPEPVVRAHCVERFWRSHVRGR